MSNFKPVDSDGFQTGAETVMFRRGRSGDRPFRLSVPE